MHNESNESVINANHANYYQRMLNCVVILCLLLNTQTCFTMTAGLVMWSTNVNV